MALEYRLDALGWFNFERLVEAILKTAIGSDVPPFGGNRDEGRYTHYAGVAPFPTASEQWNGNWIFQVKFHGIGSQGDAGARRRLLSEFRQEIGSILERAGDVPDNYVLISNTDLRPRDRTELRAIAVAAEFHGHLHVISGKDICDFLHSYVDLRRTFPQLLAPADFVGIADQAIRQRNKALFERYQRDLGQFIRTEAYERACEVLQKCHFVVLDGPPDAGKTSICTALAAIHAGRGFEVIQVNNPADFFQCYDSSRSQFFAADDAIGTTAPNHGLLMSWDRDLQNVVHKLDREHLLAWTTRRDLLEAAKEDARLAIVVSGFAAPNEVVVSAGKLTELERAELSIITRSMQGHPVP